MNYDIFSKSKVLDFIGKVMEIVGYRQYNQIGNVIDSSHNGAREIELVEVSAILYVFLSKKLPIIIRDIQDNNEESHRCIKELEELINKCEKNELCGLYDFLERGY